MAIRVNMFKFFEALDDIYILPCFFDSKRIIKGKQFQAYVVIFKRYKDSSD